jgi:polysaccharide biosynthesis protein PelA
VEEQADRSLGSPSTDSQAPRRAWLGGRPSRRAVLATMAAGLAIPAFGAGTWLVGDMRTKKLRWVVFYGQTADEAILATYDIVILDPGFLGSIEAVARSGTQVFGYLSLGEIRTTNPFFDRLDPEAVLEENVHWPGTRRIDIRHPSWRSLVLDHLVPQIRAQGFAGLMLDTLDTPPHLEQIDPKRNAGMRKAAIDLVHAIHRRQPRMKLIMNRGYALLPKLIDILDALIAESLLTRPGPDGGSPVLANERDVAQQLAQLAPAKHRWSAVPILTLDYWAPEDTATIEVIYRRERALGHHPYVATPLLDRIVPEPSNGQQIDDMGI